MLVQNGIMNKLSFSAYLFSERMHAMITTVCMCVDCVKQIGFLIFVCGQEVDVNSEEVTYNQTHVSHGNIITSFT